MALQVKERAAKLSDLTLIQNPHGGRKKLSHTNCPNFHIHAVACTCAHACVQTHTHTLNIIKSFTKSTGVRGGSGLAKEVLIWGMGWSRILRHTLP